MTAAFKELRQKAITETQSSMTAIRVELFRLHAELIGLGGEDSYEDSLLKIIRSRENSNVCTSDLHEVFPDSSKLADARLTLVEAGAITEGKKGNSWLLTAVPQGSRSPEGSPASAAEPEAAEASV